MRQVYIKSKSNSCYQPKIVKYHQINSKFLTKFIVFLCFCVSDVFCNIWLTCNGNNGFIISVLFWSIRKRKWKRKHFNRFVGKKRKFCSLITSHKTAAAIQITHPDSNWCLAPQLLWDNTLGFL